MCRATRYVCATCVIIYLTPGYVHAPSYVHLPRTDQNRPRCVRLAIAIYLFLYVNLVLMVEIKKLSLSQRSMCRYIRLNTLNVHLTLASTPTFFGNKPGLRNNLRMQFNA